MRLRRRNNALQGWKGFAVFCILFTLTPLFAFGLRMNFSEAPRGEGSFLNNQLSILPSPTPIDPKEKELQDKAKQIEGLSRENYILVSRGKERTYSMKSYVYQVCDQYGKKHGVPKEVWYPIIMMESGGNPTATTITSKEDSRGLLQVNTKVHSIGKVEAYDIEKNLSWQMPVLAKTYREAKARGLKGLDVVLYVERYGQRCQWTKAVEQSLTKYYNEITGGKR